MFRRMTPVYSTTEGELDGYRTVVLRSADAGLEAAFAPEAGMLGCSLAHEGEELLHLGRGLERYVREGKTIGIPLLHPWANRLTGFSYPSPVGEVEMDRDSPLIQTDANGLPIHGLLTGSPHWRLLESSADKHSATLRAELDFGAHEDLLAAFPFPHRLEVQAHLEDAALTIRTSVSATGAVPVPVSFGYHPYLCLPGIAREDWEIELPVRRRLELDERMIPTGKSEPASFPREPLGRRAFDDGFAELLPGRPFVLEGGGRQLELKFEEGYPFAQVYAPAGQQFICFEPMTAPTNALVTRGADLPIVQPAGSFQAAFSISVSGKRSQGQG
jgi:galactose mutarotase-like enzyme